MKLKNVFVALSASAMLVAPMAAQAGTVASASVGKIANLSGPAARQSASVQKKQKADSGVVVVGVLAGAAAVYGLVELLDDGGSSGD